MRKALVVALVLALVALVGLTGCAKIAEKAIEDATGVSVDEDDGTVTIEGEDGASITVNDEGTELPEGYPDDAPVYDGTIASAWESTDQGKTTYMVSVTTKDSIGDVVDWYKSELESEGWTITTTFKDASSGMINAEKDDRVFYMAAGTGSDGTDISQTLSPK